MTMHRLTAGAGYRYLLRHIATGDCTRTGPDPMTAYYMQTGTPPGRWLGRGLTSLGATAPGPPVPAIGTGAIVGDEAMARLFAHGVDPATGRPLGRPYPPTIAPAERVAARVRALPQGMTPEARYTAVEAITRVELGRDTPATVAGFDLTFTVMKSVSVLWAVGDRRTQQAVRDAHDAAVAQAAGFLEDRALFTRTGHAGCRQEPTRGAVAAGFVHWDSRAGDPNLHTHVVLANKVQGLDGAWRSVDSRALHHGVVAVSELYDALLVDELTRRLPVSWGWRGRGPRRSPAFELDGLGDDLLAVFSRRAAQVEEAMVREVAEFAASHGRAPNRIEITRLRQRVTRATRPAKQAHPLGRLLQRWRARAVDVTGRTPEQLTAQVLNQASTRPVRAAEVPAGVVDQLAGVVLEGVRERRSTWTRWNVAAETLRVTKSLPAATPVDRIALTDAVCDAVLARCVALDPPDVLSVTGRYARPDGGSVFDRPDEHTFTDAVILTAEHHLLLAGTDTTAPAATVLEADLHLAGQPGRQLADDQSAAVRNIAGSGRRVDLLVGPAGSGKTTTLAALRQVWERQHGRGSVIGLAPSSTAAANLAGALGIPCENTAKWLHESTGPAGRQRRDVIEHLTTERTTLTGLAALTRARTIDTALAGLTREDRRWALHGGQLLVVDEASLAGTLTLDDLTAQAQTAGAKVLLVGDHAQLSAVDAGGAFGLLGDRTGGAHLRTLWRFTHRWEAAATTGLRAGNPKVIDVYNQEGRLHAGPGESMLEDAYTAWSTDVSDGYAAILLAPDTATVTALNTRAHDDRVQDGDVQPGGITTADGTVVGVGDRVVTRLNDRHLRHRGGYVRNGDLWDVHAIDTDGNLTVAPARTRTARRGIVGTPGSDDHTLVVLPAAYAAANLDLAYATTTHRAQGITVERAHVLAHAGITRENLYVAMTRGRDANHLYLAVDHLDADCDDRPDPHAATDPHDLLTTILATTGAEQSATTTIAARQDNATSLRRLDPIRRTLYADAARARWTTRLTDLGADQTWIQQLLASPDAGRVFVALDRIAALADEPDTVVRRIVHSSVGSDEPIARLLGTASGWLRRHVDDVDELPVVHEIDGLDSDGRAVLDQVEHLIADRASALIEAARPDQPDWLDDLGPEPPDGPEREQWLAQLAATAARHDHQPRPAVGGATAAAEPALTR